MNNIQKIAAAMALMLPLATLASPAEPLPEQLPPDQEAAALKAAEATGRELYRHDQAGAVVSDAVLEHQLIRRDRRIAGWITERRGTDIVVTFYGADRGQSPQALYRAMVSAAGTLTGPLETLDPPMQLTDSEAAAVAARTAALGSGFTPCSKQYNTVVLPEGEGADRHWTVYLLPGTIKRGVVPIGGTYRVQITADGKTVMATRAFTRSCIALDSGGRGDDKPVVMIITHTLDPVPTEAHVFWSLWAHMPMFVLTPPNGTEWGIENGHIELMERSKFKP
jgi:hypothetical protein